MFPANPGDADLAGNIPEDDIGRPSVGGDQPHDIINRFTSAMDTDWRQHHAFMIKLSRGTKGAAWYCPANISLMRNRGSKGDESAFKENRRDKPHIGGMWHIAFIRVVGDKYITIREILQPVQVFDALDEMEINRRMEKHPRCNQQAAIWVDNDAAEITAFPDDG